MSFIDYYKSRLCRIYPSIIIYLIVISVILWFTTEGARLIDHMAYWVSELTLFSFFTPPRFYSFGVGNPNGSLWTTSVFLESYICTYIFRRLLVKNRTKNGKIIVALFVLFFLFTTLPVYLGAMMIVIYLFATKILLYHTSIYSVLVGQYTCTVTI